MQLLGHRAVALRRLTLEAAERGEIALALQHGLDAVGTERPDQLVLEVVDAREEADGLQAVRDRGRRRRRPAPAPARRPAASATS